jgi:hypothetical protein
VIAKAFTAGWSLLLVVALTRRRWRLPAAALQAHRDRVAIAARFGI